MLKSTLRVYLLLLILQLIFPPGWTLVKDLRCYQCEYFGNQKDSSCKSDDIAPRDKYLKTCPPYTGKGDYQQPVCAIWTFRRNKESKTSIRRQCLYMGVHLNKNVWNKYGLLKPKTVKVSNFTTPSGETYSMNKYYICNDNHGCNADINGNLQKR
jgi:hypothetical protein